MKYCSKCGKELLDEAVICPGCGCSVAPINTPVVNSEPDEVSIGFCVLAFFVPLFGIIYWAIKSKETPKKAKACGITAIVSWVISFIFGLIYGAIVGGLMGVYLNNLL